MIEAHILAVLQRDGVSVAKLAERLGTSPNQVYRLLRTTPVPDGKSAGDVKRRITYEWIVKIAGALGRPPADLLPSDDNPYRLAEDELRAVSAYRAIAPDLRPRVAPMLQALAGVNEISTAERDILSRIRALDAASRAMVEKLLAA